MTNILSITNKHPNPLGADDELLPPWTYSDPDFFKKEVVHLFKKTWLLAGHISDLSAPGDFITFNAFGERALIIRDDADKLRGFHNVCRHRGSRVLRHAQGNCKNAIICPFHGWTYNLDGSLKNVPMAHTFSDLKKDKIGLVPLEIDIWNGFIFIRFGGNGASISEQLQPIANKLECYQLDEIKPLAATHTETRPYNWKVVHDIDNEGYHVPIGHPSLQQLYGKNYKDRIEHGITCSYGYLNDEPGSLWSVKHYQDMLPSFAHLPEDKQRLWFYVGLFPNLVFAFYPDMMEVYMTIPKSPTETLFISRIFALPDDRREVKLARYLNQRINRMTDKEDESFVRWIQEGLRSSVFPAGNLSSLEVGVLDFHRKIREAVPA